MSPAKSTASYTLIGGEESYRNKLNQSPMAMRRLENFIPSLRGDLEQKDASFSFSPGQTPAVMFQYKRVENDGSVTRLLLYAANVAGTGWKVFKLVGTATVATELFPGSTLYAPLAAEPVFVQPNNNVCYFTDGERWYGTDGASVQLAGMDHPLDPPTFTTAAGILNVTVNRFYWVAWADNGSTASPEITQIGNSSPISAGTGVLLNSAVTITRPVSPPRRATHWLLFASETDGDAVFGALLAIIPVATTTFVDQSPFLDQSGTAMVAIRRPIRNGPMIPGSHTVLYKGRIFVCGYNRVPYVIRNPSFEDSIGANLNGWTSAAGAQETVTSDTAQVFDGPGSVKLVRATGASGVQGGIFQDVSKILKPGRFYRIEVAARSASVAGTTATVRIEVTDGAGASLSPAILNDVLTSSSTVGTFTRTVALNFFLPAIPSNGLRLTLHTKTDDTTSAITGNLDFIRVWEMIPPATAAFSALEEVEGLRNGRGEESFPGSTPTPQDADSSDIVNILSYPQEASQLIGMASHLDNLIVFSDVSGAFLLGASFDDFGFTDLAFGMGLASRFASTNSRVGLFFVSYDLKVMHLPPPTSAFESSILPEEISLPIRDQLGGPVARMDNTQPVWLKVFDYGSRAWLLLTYSTVGGTGRVFRLYDLETKMWFKFTELTSPQPVVVYEASAGKKTLLCADQSNGSIQAVSDIMNAYPAPGGTVPAAIFRQALFDLDDPGSFKDWKDISVHSSAPVAGTFWIDAVDPTNPGTGAAIPFAPLEQLPELSRAFLSQLSNSYGKRILIEVTLGAGAAAGKFGTVYGIEVTADARTRYAR